MITGERKKAISTLEKITNVQDSLCQNTLYILWYCYLAEGQKNTARVALRAASKMDFDQAICQVEI